jgi:hypothetical protein
LDSDEENEISSISDSYAVNDTQFGAIVDHQKRAVLLWQKTTELDKIRVVSLNLTNDFLMNSSPLASALLSLSAIISI